MRAIKFRAWDREEYLDWDSLTCPSISVPELFNGDLLLEQYTGLKDKNGKEIYEGDILRILYTDWPSQTDFSITLQEHKISKASAGFVEYQVDKYCVNFGLGRFGEFSYGRILPGKHGETEIIGNIHETPELLKDGGLSSEN